MHLAAWNIGVDMEEALNTAIHATNFVKSNSVNDRSFLNSVKMKIVKPFGCTQKKDD